MTALVPPRDIDGDLAGEIVLVQHEQFPGAARQTVVVVDGASRQPVQTFGEDVAQRFAHQYSIAPDLDGDGLMDIAISRPRESSFVENGGVVEIRGSADGELLLSLHGAAQSALGRGLATVSDITGDGTPELAVAASAFDATGWAWGRVFLLDLVNRRALAVFEGEQAADGFGAAIAPIGDIDGDGFGDLAISAPDFIDLDGDATTPGRVYVFRGGPTLAAPVLRYAEISAHAVLDNSDRSAAIFAAGLVRGAPTAAGDPTLVTISPTARLAGPGPHRFTRWNLATNQPLPTKTVAIGATSATLPGDVDGSQSVDSSDLVLTAAAYGTTVADNPGVAAMDINQNAVVDHADLAAVIANIGATGPLAEDIASAAEVQSVLAAVVSSYIDPPGQISLQPLDPNAPGNSPCNGGPLCIPSLEPPLTPDEPDLEPYNPPDLPFDELFPEMLEPGRDRSDLSPPGDSGDGDGSDGDGDDDGCDKPDLSGGDRVENALGRLVRIGTPNERRAIGQQTSERPPRSASARPSAVQTANPGQIRPGRQPRARATRNHAASWAAVVRAARVKPPNHRSSTIRPDSSFLSPALSPA